MPEPRATLQQHWLQHSLGIGIERPSMALLTQLVAAWSEPQRHFHTLRHLQECLQHLDRWGRDHPLLPAIGMALWFHDALYDPARSDNEDRSARWATSALTELEADPAAVKMISNLVRATADRRKTRITDEQALILDADLAILGADRARFEQHERQLQLEFTHLDPAAYAALRAGYADSLLQRERIFRSATAHAQLERQARENLRRSSRRWSRAVVNSA